MGKKVKVLRKVYISPDDLQELDKAAGIGEKGEGKLEYVCLRAVWRETSEEKPDDGAWVIFMVAEQGEESKIQLSDICMGIYNAPSEPDEYGDDGEGFYSNDNCCFSCGEVFGWAYAEDLVPGFKKKGKDDNNDNHNPLRGCRLPDDSRRKRRQGTMIRMNKATRRLLRENYNRACNAYADAFCEKHGWHKLGESVVTFWVADEPGGILNIGETTFSMQTILTDIDEDAPEGEVLNWDDYCSEVWDVMGHGHEVPNFHSWLHGCPRISEDVLQHIREQKERLKKAIEEAEDY